MRAKELKILPGTWQDLIQIYFQVFLDTKVTKLCEPSILGVNLQTNILSVYIECRIIVETSYYLGQFFIK
jgi:hypothetical protein